ncbi:hypothetical protein EV426DRAFT_599082 [Tirmania nivea]|nr:hypothetical protein EV426DRAFT_599082 [Tirmania nivea]
MSNNRKGEDDFFGHFCQNVRRFTDQHISSMLHSLIGLPSMVTPPAGGTWVIIDEELRPRKERAYSDDERRLEGKTMEEIQNMKAAWIAERDGGARGVEVVEGGKAKAETGGSSSSPSSTSTAAPGSGRAIYVFRFPSSSSSDGYSDYYSPDAQRQIDRLNSQMLRSFYRDELFQCGPFPSLFGLLHPFMFSPFAGLPWHYYHGFRDPIEEGLDEFDQWRRMRDEGLRWRRKVYGHYNSEYSDSSRIEDKESDGGEIAISKDETQQPPSLPAPPQQEAANPMPETELDLYDHLDLASSNDKSLTDQNSTTRCITGISTSTESRTSPDGSTFTKTVKITRYADGTEERVENEHRTPPIRGNAVRAIQRNRTGVVGAEDDGSDSGEGTIVELSPDRGLRGNEDEKKELHEFDRRLFDYLMRSPFFREARRAEHSDKENIVNFTFPRQTSYDSMNKPKCSPEGENSATPNEPAAQSNGPTAEGNSGRKWGWFWSK